MKKRMTPELLWQMGRLGDAAVSPDQSQIAFTVKRYSLEENSGTSTLHIMDLASGSDTKVIEDWKSIGSLQWFASADDQRIFFEGQMNSPTDPALTLPKKNHRVNLLMTIKPQHRLGC